MISIERVDRSYRTDTVETTALEDISLQVSAGEFVAIAGPSGSGKSTLLNIAGLLETVDAGTYHLDGLNVSHLTDRQRSKIRNEKIGFIFQSFNLIADLNIYDNIDVPLRYRGVPARERRKRIEDVINRVGLSGRIKHYPSQLSGGQQQRAAIARALVGEPALLLADEPTGNLDTEMASGVMELLLQLQEDGATVVMVTHDLDLAQQAQRQIHIRDGSIELDP